MPKVEHRKYGELKTRRSFLLTPTAIGMLEELAKKSGVSMNEFLEQTIRNLRAELVYEEMLDNDAVI